MISLICIDTDDLSIDRQDAFEDDVLTEAEKRVARGVARGFNNKQIAAEFGLSVRTIENHISRILAKSPSLTGLSLPATYSERLIERRSHVTCG